LKIKTTVFLQLYFRGRGTNIHNRYGPGTGPILMDDLRCIGNETTIAECRHRGWYYHNCNHSEDVSVSCVPSSMWHYAYHFTRATVFWRGMTLCLSVKVRSHRMLCGALRHRAACCVVFVAYSKTSGRNAPHHTAMQRSAPYTELTNLHKPVLYQKCWLKRSSWFWHVGFPRLMPQVHCVKNKK